MNCVGGGGNEEIKTTQKTDLSSWQIFYRYVFKNLNVWYVALMETFVYVVRFGLVSWIPIYLLNTKGFTKEQMSVAFFLFESAAMPSVLFAGYISDKFFKGLRMPLAIGATVIIFFMIIGYFVSNNLYLVIFFVAMAGCLIYVPQFLIGVQSVEIVPSFAVGSAVGLTGFMSYVVGASLGTKAIGWAVDYYKSWNAGLIMLLSACVLCIFFSILCHFSAKKLQKNKGVGYV